MKRTLPPLSPLSRNARARLSRFPGLRGPGSATIFTRAQKRRMKRDQMRRYRRKLHCTKMQQQFPEFNVAAKRAPVAVETSTCTHTEFDAKVRKSGKVEISAIPEIGRGTELKIAHTRKAKKRVVKFERVPNSFPARPIRWSSWWEE